MPTDTLQTRPKMRYACDELEKFAHKLGPHGQLPTMVQLRDDLGVSMRTLNDALREMEKRKVLRSVHGVGIFVETQQKRAATGSIGFLAAARMTSVKNLTYFGLITAGMRQAASRNKQDILFIDNTVPYENWAKLDGVVLYATTDPEGLVPGVQAVPQDIPVVSVVETKAGVSSVVGDDYRGTYLLTQHLIAQGHRRIAWLSGHPEQVPILQRRWAGHVAAMNEAGLECEPAWTHFMSLRKEWYDTDDWYFLGGEYYTRQWIEEDWRELGCTALMAQNDEAAYGAIAALTKAGIAVPDQVTVTGFDGIGSTNSLLPSLPTIRVPLLEMGRRAVGLLGSRIDNPELPLENICLPIELVRG